MKNHNFLLLLLLFTSVVFSQEKSIDDSSSLIEMIKKNNKKVLDFKSKELNNKDIVNKTEVITIGGETYIDDFNLRSNDTIYVDLMIDTSFFNKGFKINYQKLNGDIILRDVNFRNAEFNSTQFKGKAVFSLSHFKNIAHFKRVKFFKHSKPEFVSTIFDSIANFNYAKFFDEVSFESTIFGQKVDFTEAKFFDEVSFYHAKLPDTLIFDRIKSKEEIDLTHVKLKKGKEFCYISLSDASINQIKIRYEKFKLLIPTEIKKDSTFEKLTNVYENLLNNFKKDGYVTSYEKLDKEYQEFKFTQNPKNNGIQKLTGKFLNTLNFLWNDYGYDKARIWPITIGLFFFFLLINYLSFNKLIKVVYPVPEIKKSYIDSNEKSRLISSFFFTSFIFFGFKLKTELFNLKHPKTSIYVFSQYILGLVCLAYIANFVISSTLIGS